VFLTLLEAQNLSKFLGHVREFIFFHEESKNSEFSSKGGPLKKRMPGDATHQAKKPIF